MNVSPLSGTLYALVDPRDDSVRYIGQTAKALAERLAGHIANPAPRVGEWISELQQAGLAPKSVALREGIPVLDLLVAEKEEITRRIAAGEELLNSTVTAAGREIRKRRAEEARIANERQTWRDVAERVRMAVGGVMPPGELPLIPIGPRAMRAFQETLLIAAEAETERTPGDDNHLSKATRLQLARGTASDELWSATGGAWTRLTSMARDRLSCRLEACIGGAVDRAWQSWDDMSRYLALVPWALIAVTPWADLAQRAGIDSEAEFANWASDDPTVREALAFLADHGGNVLAGLKAPEVRGQGPTPATALSAMAAAHCDFDLPELLHRDAARLLRDAAKDRQLTAPMADLLYKLDPKALDTAFGPDVVRDLDQQLHLPQGTSLRVLSALLQDHRMGPLGVLDDVVTRAGRAMPTVPAPDYWRWTGDEVPILIGIVGRLVEVAAMPPPRGLEKGQYLDEVRSLWQMDSRFENRGQGAA
ncbi:hypothetical protein [Streptomyces antimycoticus]